MAPPSPARFFRFGAFQLDLRARELSRNGIKVRIPEQSIQVLTMLLEHPGEVVTREELHHRLWPNGTIVEFEHSIYAAIKRLRQALDDSGGTPRYVETLPRLGYRFIGPIERTPSGAEQEQAREEAVPVEPKAGKPEAGEPETSPGELEGEVVSHYRILEKLGSGGMGVVYKAEDTRLGRTVALKFLPDLFSDDPAALERFQREARAASALNHPNICTLYDIGRADGRPFLAMEYLEGQTLGQRMAVKPLGFDEILNLSIQIADALDSAHRHGVIHRDLKPGNIMLTKSGAKLLDFGLAKMRPRESVAGLTALPPTQTTPLTSEGAILGTLQYMAPEQLEGKEADARTDIFAFGAVLYEMLTGHKAFAGKSHASLIAAILEHNPQPISALQPLTPPALDHVLRTCLAKDPNERRQSAHDLMLELKWIIDGKSQVGVPSTAVSLRKSRERLTWVLVSAALLAALILVTIHFGRSARESQLMRFSIFPPQKHTFEGALAVSPDGQRLVLVVSTTEGGQSLWVRGMDSIVSQPLAGTEGADYPFWSPDSQSIGFLAGEKLKRIDASGGPAQTICDASGGGLGTWNSDGVIVFGRRRGLYRVSAEGGDATPVITPDKSRREASYDKPQFLPDGHHFLYLVYSQRGASGIYAGSLDSKEVKRLVDSDSMAVYAPGLDAGKGYLLFIRDGTLLAQRFNTGHLQLTGKPVPIASGVWASQTDLVFSVSSNGVLSYRTEAENTQLTWFDRAGRQLPTVELTGDKRVPKLSPDGRQVAFERVDPQKGMLTIWLLELARGATSRFTTGFAPVWSPAGDRIVYTSFVNDRAILYQRWGRAVKEELLLELDATFAYATDWSVDGRFLAYTSFKDETKMDLWVLPLEGERKPFPFLRTEFNEIYGHFSPDGKWIAYASDESGKWEIYARSFNRDGASIEKRQISTQGGIHPIWRRDGKELFYIGSDRKLMAVDVKLSDIQGRPVLEPSVPKALFDTGTKFSTVVPYAPSADGQRFLVITELADGAAQPINVVVNWTAGLKR